MSSFQELELYNEDLLAKPAVLVVNKMDTEDAEEKLLALKEALSGDEEYSKLGEDVKPAQRIEFREIVSSQLGSTSSDPWSTRKRNSKSSSNNFMRKSSPLIEGRFLGQSDL